ncbi:group II truncated hemoglobin [Stutzerimonas zhaodongensis]|uniref:group II truncated hemoglobin n=1 Tax=Stutzerimonas zhaodongensis TaxID=1176257 RepID=UPI0021054C42|nr:group II truncated hemoglobin [Stutzerimonas zhaodongensis]MCQ2028607.1 group II truncated hemoglobin [Stutzerimonas zhaodongensis]
MSEAGPLPYGTADTSFLAAGGESGITRLVTDFYRIMEDHEGAACVRRLYPDDLSEPSARLAAFLCGWLGGPRRYAERYGGINIPHFHTRWPVGEAERDAWLECMALAIGKQGYTPEFSSYLLAQLQIPAERIVHAQHACPHGS